MAKKWLLLELKNQNYSTLFLNFDMKKLILLLFIPLVFNCSSDDEVEECLPNIDLVGSWYWGDQVIVFTENTFAYYSNDETLSLIHI